mmetsp:Transcript_126758/g.370489  ORF Transcript_126758/g.370489 Transcript_126758/m.370489 type:complete len:213 (-) Transcript_126758:846-1484(-)
MTWNSVGLALLDGRCSVRQCSTSRPSSSCRTISMLLSSPHSASVANLKRMTPRSRALSQRSRTLPRPFPSAKLSSARRQPSASSSSGPSTSVPGMISTFARRPPSSLFMMNRDLPSAMRHSPSSSETFVSLRMEKWWAFRASSGPQSFMLPTRRRGSLTSILGLCFLSSYLAARASNIFGSTFVSCCFLSSDMSLYLVLAACASACHFFRAS